MGVSDSIRLKLERAKELKEKIRQWSIAWAESDPYEFVTHAADVGDPVNSHIKYLAVVGVPLPGEWMSQRLGDAIGNYRPSLIT
jgi:hypothetical protein